MRMWVPLIGLLLGVLLGLALRVEIPLGFVKYTAIAVLAALDTLLGGFRAQLEGRFDLVVFTSGFLVNASVAALLAAIGDLLGVDIYLGAVIVFSMRILQNVSLIRRDLLRPFVREGPPWTPGGPQWVPQDPERRPESG
ncbi:MAG: small basic family protein [Armatimonadota bacterium]|nr:small basic family protein [Armatimonadota bacterium]MDR7439898.1 small basic family protein [Armatimonadota bacterium]MDR7443459.1 small basic family protein [Armatimonadota bacterium]MDR7569297.1 small basic family protein [Armatimonadota bacterium]MDR7614957.1 small basic family protein [Armatimonadota bacterium]